MKIIKKFNWFHPSVDRKTQPFQSGDTPYTCKKFRIRVFLYTLVRQGSLPAETSEKRRGSTTYQQPTGFSLQQHASCARGHAPADPYSARRAPSPVPSPWNLAWLLSRLFSAVQGESCPRVAKSESEASSRLYFIFAKLDWTTCFYSRGKRFLDLLLGFGASENGLS